MSTTRRIARQMSAYIGISPDYILRSDLRIDLSHFETELLRETHRATGIRRLVHTRPPGRRLILRILRHDAQDRMRTHQTLQRHH